MRPIPGLGNYQGQRLKKIDRKAVTLSGQVVFDLPQDIVGKELLVIHDYTVTPTFASGSPSVHPRGVLHGILSSLEIARSGNDVVKVFRGVAQLQDQAQWIFGEACPSLYKVNSTTLNGSEITGAVALGATTVPVSGREVVAIPFENKLSSEWVRSCLNLTGINTAKVRMNFGAAAAIQNPEDSASCTFAYSGYVTLYVVTADHLGDVAFDDWRQYYDEITFNSQANRSVVELRPLGLLQGVHLRAFAGAHSNGHYKPMNTEELRNFEIEIKFNDNTLFEGNLADFQSLNGAKSSMRAFLRSSAYLNCLNNSTYDSGLETGQDAKAVTPLRLTVTTPSSINHATNPVRLVAEYDIISRRKA